MDESPRVHRISEATVRRRQRRISGGRVEAWRAAFAEFRRVRSRLWLPLAFVLGVVVVLNLPWFPPYQRGLWTGVFATAALWGLSWTIWVTSGLSWRLNGIWAEDVTVDVLRRHERVLGVVPSLKFGGWDIDAVAVTASGVLALESKWQLPADEDRVAQHCQGAAERARTLKLYLKREGLPDDLVRPVLVLWGPGSRDTAIRTIPTPLTSVTVVPGSRLEQWLADLPSGPIGTDYGTALTIELAQLAADREAHGPQPGALLRYLGRVR